MPKFNKQYGILKLMLGHFNICCFILIKIFILVTYVNFDLCSLLRYVTKNGMCDVNTDPPTKKRCNILKGQESIGSLSSVFFCHSTTEIIRDFSQIQNPHWIMIQASSSFENITSFLWLRISVDITHAIFCNISQKWT